MKTVIICAHFLRRSHKKPGFPGVPPALCAGRCAPLQSLAPHGLQKMVLFWNWLEYLF
jgi:hypothetical protein